MIDLIRALQTENVRVQRTTQASDVNKVAIGVDAMVSRILCGVRFNALT